MKHRFFFSIMAFTLVLCVAGCSIMPFEDPEEQRLQEKQVAVQQTDTLVIPEELLSADLVVDEKLTNTAGQILAQYRVSLPQFAVEDDKKGQSFQRINEYYQSQMTGAKEDCECLFAAAREHYGANWAAAAVKQTIYSTEMTYSLTDAPDNYLCILRAYKLCEGTTETEVYRNAEVFLLDSGWRLTLEELFGSKYEEAEPLLAEAVRSWCMNHGMSEEAAEKLEVEDFKQGFGMDEDSLLFFLPAFTISNTDNQARTVSIPLSDFSELLPESVNITEEQTNDASPAHSA